MKNISYQPNLQEKIRKNETVICVSFKYKDTEIRDKNKVCHEPITCVVRKQESKKK